MGTVSTVSLVVLKTAKAVEWNIGGFRITQLKQGVNETIKRET